MVARVVGSPATAAFPATFACARASARAAANASCSLALRTHPVRSIANEAWRHVLNPSRMAVPGMRDLFCPGPFVEALFVHSARRP